MNSLNFSHYNFYYYICKNTTSRVLSICFVPRSATFHALMYKKENTKKITYEIYNFLEDELGDSIDFKPVFSENIGVYEIEVLNVYPNMSFVSQKLRKDLQALA